MNYWYKYLGAVIVTSLMGCGMLTEPVKETSNGYELQKNTSLRVILQTPLSSNTNERGDQFTTYLAQALVFKEKAILPKDTQIRGLVKRVKKYEKLGDRASLFLLFDQIVFSDGIRIPLVASLNTEEGDRVIKIKGKALKDTTIIGGSALVGTVVGRKTLGKDGAKKGLIVGAGLGTGAVLLSNMKEIKLPAGTELVIKLDELLLLPKE
ncbi:MAG: hypothetical protein KJ593_02440 [Candidatus Omnitrophica bacterium]|nr:hypothetical protein [Candidatus Omnitrophota bacterium]